ncbi:MAG TPA: hypothetical protein VFX76_02965 [Roseiflexaceae bacterium]|nr:hypothetical protein [Roseiflexaceae bacterium]
MGSKASVSEDTDEFLPHADDFTRIPGIGPVIQQQLYEAGIIRYAQLAALTAEQIGQLVANLPLLSTERIAKQNWPAQAHALAAQSGLDEHGAADGRLRYATFSVELLLDPSSRVRRTRVAHLQDGDESGWAGWDHARMIDFFAKHATLESAARIAEAAEARVTVPPHAHSALATNDGLWLEIGEIRLGEAPQASYPGKATGTTRAQAQLVFRLNGARAAQAHAETLPFAASLLAYPLAGKQMLILDSWREQLSSSYIEQELSFEFDLPQKGRYQLVATIVIADAGVVGSALGPVLRII